MNSPAKEEESVRHVLADDLHEPMAALALSALALSDLHEAKAALAMRALTLSASKTALRSFAIASAIRASSCSRLALAMIAGLSDGITERRSR